MQDGGGQADSYGRRNLDVCTNPLGRSGRLRNNSCRKSVCVGAGSSSIPEVQSATNHDNVSFIESFLRSNVKWLTAWGWGCFHSLLSGLRSSTDKVRRLLCKRKKKIQEEKKVLEKKLSVKSYNPVLLSFWNTAFSWHDVLALNCWEKRWRLMFFLGLD